MKKVITTAFLGLLPLILFSISRPVQWKSLLPENLENSAVRGDSYSQAVLGFCLHSGELGYKLNLDLARHWSQQAVASGEPLGYYNLGSISLQEGNFDESTKYYKLAKIGLSDRIDSNDSISIYAMAEIHFVLKPVDIPKSLELFRKSSELGFPAADSTLGALYLMGLPNYLEPDSAYGTKLLSRAASLNSLGGRVNLGIAFRDGDGVEQNSTLAMKWLELAANQDFVPAQIALGELLINPSNYLHSNFDKIKVLFESIQSNAIADLVVKEKAKIGIELLGIYRELNDLKEALASLEIGLKSEKAVPEDEKKVLDKIKLQYDRIESQINQVYDYFVGYDANDTSDQSPSQSGKSPPDRNPEEKILINGVESFNEESLISYLKSEFKIRDGNASVDEEKLDINLDEVTEALERILLKHGFVDGAVKSSILNENQSPQLVIEIEEGQRFEFLGYKEPDATPEWLSGTISSILNLHPSSSKKVSDLRFGRIKILSSDKSKLSWFGEADLANLSMLESQDEFPGFRLDDLKSIKSQLLDHIKILQKNPRATYPVLLDAEESIEAIIACLSARNGFPGARFKFEAVKSDGGYYLVPKVFNLDEPLRLASLSIEGLKVHKPEFVSKWILEKNKLKKGDILTTKKLIAIKNSLLESACFFDVGLYPNTISGEAILKIILKDHEKLPRLDQELSEVEKSRIDIGRFVFRGPELFKGKFSLGQAIDYNGSLEFLWFPSDNIFQLKFFDQKDNLRGSVSLVENYLSLSLGGEIFHAKLAVSLMGGVTARIQDEKDDRIQQLNMFFGFKSGVQVSRMEVYMEPSLFAVKNKKWEYSLTRSSDKKEVLKISDGTRLKIVRDDNLEIINVSSEDERASVEIYRNVPAEISIPQIPSKVVSQSKDFFWDVLRATKFEESLQTYDFEQRLLIFFILPKFVEKISTTLFTDSANASFKKQSVPDFVSDGGGKFLVGPSKRFFSQDSSSLLDDFPEKLKLQKDTWPVSWVQAMVFLITSKQDEFVKRLKSAADMNEYEMGPLGNLAWGILCNQMFSKPAAIHFFKKSKNTNSYMFFQEDLERLGLKEDFTKFVIDSLKDSKLKIADKDLTPIFDILFPDGGNELVDSQEVIEKGITRFFFLMMRGKLDAVIDQLIASDKPIDE